MDAAGLVRAARDRSGLTQQDLADRAGVSRATVAMIETGSRSPSLGVLDGLMAAAGLQLHVELEPLDQDVRRLLGEVADGPAPAERVAELWSAFRGLADAAHRVEGLAAAALLGLPVPVPVCEIAFADTPETFAWLAEGLIGSGPRTGSGPGSGASPGPGSGARFWLRLPWEDRPLFLVESEARLREILDECDEGWFWLTYIFDEVRARFVPADDVGRHVTVLTERGSIPVQPMHEISCDDPRAERMLRVARAELEGSPRLEGGSRLAGDPEDGRQAPTRYPPR
ncbi:helix-turn-helix domain-containing protein [Antribacter gilvus]|uniref:helix-turn-helix domain-containing protein n=1 Tax=Antribacter gilvus TaxID=2304675 RepID=UPI001F0C3580|nr:helix-turn-helix transcriptional regulator [Antribacter gilvus]